MHIDQQKLVELLVETSGMDEKEVEKRIKELVKDIRQAIDGGDGYEIPGFGMFTGFGSVLTFIPSKELEMEINYKYAGMQPIELDESQVAAVEEPAADETVEETEEALENPFAGLIDDEDIVEADKKVAEEESAESTEDDPGPEKWGIDTYKDDSAESVFGTMLGEDVFEESADEEAPVVEDPEPVEPEAQVEKDVEPEPETEVEAVAEEESASEPEEETVEEGESGETSLADELADALDENPFEEIIEDKAEEVEEKPKEETKKAKKKDVIPVITNVSSGKAKKSSKEPKKEEEPKEEPKKKKAPAKTNKKEAQQASPWLLALVFVVILGAAGWALISFDVISVPWFGGSDPQPVAVNNTPPPPAPVQEPVQNDDTQVGNTISNDEVPVSNDETTANTNTEQPEVVQDEEQPAANTVTATTPGAEGDMGLFGKAETEMADVYTIVLFSLSNEQNARAKIAELEAEGLKARLTSYSSERFGTLWRVSIGHFATITDAAIATDDLDAKYIDNFFITKL